MLFVIDNIMQRISAVVAALYNWRAWYRPQYKHGQGGRGIKSAMIPRLPPQEAQDPLYFSGAEARGGRRQERYFFFLSCSRKVVRSIILMP